MASNRYFICRTCLKSKHQHECVNICLYDENNSYILEMLSFTIPELDILLVNDPVICRSCVNLLKTSFDFKTECLKNEEYILKHSQNNNKRINISEIRPLHPLKTTNRIVKESASISKQKFVITQTNSLLSCENCKGCTNLSPDPTLHSKICLSPIICYNCNKPFENLQELSKHVLGHVRPRKCKICQKQFRDLYTLKVHLRVHTKSSPYKCNLCDKSFRQNYSLKQHIDKHVGSKRVSCKYCNKVFSTKYNAKIHMKSMHKKLEKCDLCGERFATKSELVKHLHTSTELCKGVEIKREVEVDFEDQTFVDTNFIKIESIKTDSDSENFVDVMSI